MMNSDEATAVWNAAENVVNAQVKYPNGAACLAMIQVTAEQWEDAVRVAKAWMEENEAPRWI